MQRVIVTGYFDAYASCICMHLTAIYGYTTQANLIDAGPVREATKSFALDSELRYHRRNSEKYPAQFDVRQHICW